MKCEICGEEFSESKKFHMHVARKHKTRIEVYYREHFPRFDLLTNEPIKFKSFEFYFSSLFNRRENLINFLRLYPEKKENIINHVFKLRQKVKKMVFVPSTVEARTSILPSPALLIHLGMDYNEVCQAYEMSPRYEYPPTIGFKDATNFDIMVDTREQRPLNFDCNVIKSKLDFGDYTSRSHYSSVYIERKSLADLCGTLSKGYERVQKEFQRAKEFDSSIVICVEESVKAFMDVQNSPLGKKMKATAEFLAHRVREICQSYPHVQFLFLNNRNEMTPIIKKILTLSTSISKIDLQYSYDSKMLSA